MKRYQLTQRDEAVLHFLWKWKIATSTLVWVRLFPVASPKRTYNRLRELATFGYIKPVYVDKIGGFAWTLTRSGFNLIRGQLPELKESGFASEHPYHDLLCTVIHISLDLEESNPDLMLMPEQGLRRIEDSVLNEKGIPTGKHRPDGFICSRSQSKNQVIALEVHLTTKSTRRVQMWSRYYDDTYKIDSVVWVVKSPLIGRRLLEKLNSEKPDSIDKHHWITVEDILKHGWQSHLIRLNGDVISLGELARERAVKRPGNPRDKVRAKDLLCTRLIPKELNT